MERDAHETRLEENKLKNLVVIWLSKTILKGLTPENIQKFRKVERLSKKLVKIKCHLLFDETCLQNNILPNYTRIRLHDDMAKEENFVHKFRRKLVERQILNFQCKLKEITGKRTEALEDLRNSINSSLKYDALTLLVARIETKLCESLRSKHICKLRKLYGASSIYMKEEAVLYHNLSNIKISEDLASIFSLGLNCNVKSKWSPIQTKMEIEKLMTQIDHLANKKTIVVNNRDRLLTQLKHHAYTQKPDRLKDTITPQQYNIINDLRKNPNIIMKKADKSNTVVIMDKCDYDKKLHLILSDTTKFERIKKNPIESLKKQVNE